MYFENNNIKYQNEGQRLSRLFNQLSIARIGSFIIAVVAVIYFADVKNGNAISLILLFFAVSFVLLIKWHNRVKYARNHAHFLKQINVDEINRLKGDLSSFDDGNEFKSAEHSYSSDLDIFGSNSLFQLLNRTTTVTGRRMLSVCLSSPTDKQTILDRQEAIKELSAKPDYCQNIEATGLHFKDREAKFESLEDWINEPAQVHENKMLIIASYILPLATLSLLAGLIWFNISFSFLLAALLVNGLVLRKTFNYSLKIANQTNRGVTTLGAISKLVVLVEREKFSAKMLINIKNDLVKDGIHSSTQITRLVNILDFFNARTNMFYSIFNFLFMLDIHLIYWAEKWKIRNKDDVKKWFKGISEFEAIVSMARFGFANPEYTYPEISDEEYVFDTTQLGHPLINHSERKNNNFGVNGQGSVIIITGSNMSGKSTFLRTLGVNMVMAYAGAPVCASKMKVSIFQLFTSMRTQDNLEEHISSFYAELKRIKQLLTLLEKNELPIMFMLDEILKGTNSHDRHKGAMAIVKQLHRTNALGFVSTHDLELGKEAEELAYCENYSFNSKIVNDQILFDYTMSTGICRSFNASILMKKIGIEID